VKFYDNNWFRVSAIEITEQGLEKLEAARRSGVTNMPSDLIEKIKKAGADADRAVSERH
jgi:hypothetical protein